MGFLTVNLSPNEELVFKPSHDCTITNFSIKETLDEARGTMLKVGRHYGPPAQPADPATIGTLSPSTITFSPLEIRLQAGAEFVFVAAGSNPLSLALWSDHTTPSNIHSSPKKASRMAKRGGDEDIEGQIKERSPGQQNLANSSQNPASHQRKKGDKEVKVKPWVGVPPAPRKDMKKMASMSTTRSADDDEDEDDEEDEEDEGAYP